MGDTDDQNELSMGLLVNKRQSMHDRCETESSHKNNIASKSNDDLNEAGNNVKRQKRKKAGVSEKASDEEFK